MKQHPIDLLPQSVRDRDKVRQRRGRLVIAGVAMSGVLVLMTTLANVQAARARMRGEQMENRATAVLALEAHAIELRARLVELEAIILEYETTASSLNVGDVLSTVVNLLPSSVTLDHLLMTSGRRRGSRTSRSRGEAPHQGPAPRMLTGEIGGFAANDKDIAELVERLAGHGALDNVNLDFSRSRIVRELTAREFRLSFTIDLELPWEVHSTPLVQAESIR